MALVEPLLIEDSLRALFDYEVSLYLLFYVDNTVFFLMKTYTFFTRHVRCQKEEVIGYDNCHYSEFHP